MRVCILNSTTKEIENIIILDTLENFVPYKEGIELAPQHDGEFGWTWSEENNDWIKPSDPELSQEEKANVIREKRQGLLRRHVDVMSGPRWEAMTEEQKQVYRDYRQALLDITEQETFPDYVVWPTKPT
jgi:hypothetical protein